MRNRRRSYRPFRRVIRANIWAAFALLIGGLAALLEQAPVRDEMHWRWASWNDGRQHYVHYCDTWQNGRHYVEGMRLVEERTKTWPKK